MKVKNSLNASTFDKKYEKNTSPSMTVPDQTMGLREILERYTRGLPINGNVPIYDEDDDLPDPRTLDLSERHALAQSYKNELSEIHAKKSKKTLSTNVDNFVDNSTENKIDVTES